MTVEQHAWVPESCTLPTIERPLRATEFDAFFADAVLSVERLDQVRLRLVLDPSSRTAQRAADLMVRESECCSFFAFSLVASGDGLALEVAVPSTQQPILDALAARAATASS